MSKFPLATKNDSLTAQNAELLPAERMLGEMVQQAPWPGPFFSFQYSYAEIWSQGGKTQVKSRTARFEDGKLSTEAFEGELSGNAYENAIGELQRHMFDQTMAMMRSLTWFLPSIRGPHSGRD